jgi:small ligand-binding sensory domain FIST
LFLGDDAGTTIGALQISCLARGQGLYGRPNVDLQHVEGLLHHDDAKSPPIAGFFASAEIGPLVVGIRMGADHQKSKSTYMLSKVLIDFL